MYVCILLKKSSHSPSSLPDCFRWSPKILVECAVPEREKQPHNEMLPPPWLHSRRFTVFKRFDHQKKPPNILQLHFGAIAPKNSFRACWCPAKFSCAFSVFGSKKGPFIDLHSSTSTSSKSTFSSCRLFLQVSNHFGRTPTQQLGWMPRPCKTWQHANLLRLLYNGFANSGFATLKRLQSCGLRLFLLVTITKTKRWRMNSNQWTFGTHSALGKL